MEALRTCKNIEEAENVVLIDVDDDSFNDVNVGFPENLPKKQDSKGLKNDKKFPLGTYIFIDDDDDESPDNHCGSKHSPNTHLAQENVTPVRLSKCKRTYPEKGSQNRYGFSMQSDVDSSDGGGPDCEFMVDSSGMLREQWERASLKRKANVVNDQCGMTENDGLSRFTADTSNYFGASRDKQSCAVFSSGSDSKEVTHEKSECTVVTVDKSEEKLTVSSEVEHEANLIPNASNMDVVLVLSSKVNEREKLKETDEYKLAIEEESARQRALKVQEEEAQWQQRLLKRRKAEELRLLDMERRQSQRVEEIRKTRKKDKKNMNLKEKYRTQVRHELKKLEATCHDMVSLLRALGILTDNSPYASTNQVRAAYKQALLRFHPDRASQADMRQQVEAEEKFKLISRMKEQVLS